MAAPAAERRSDAADGASPEARENIGPLTVMSSTFDIVADVISETSEIPREKITPEMHAIDDLGIDSLDFLDIVFALDKKFGIKIPLEQWTQEVNAGKASVEEYFLLKKPLRPYRRTDRQEERLTAKCASNISR